VVCYTNGAASADITLEVPEMAEICESCLDVVAENYPDGDDTDAAILFCVEYGKEIEDHLCDKKETDGETPCDCDCNS